MHTPNSSMAKCVASFSFLLLSLLSIWTVLWIYPPQKEYRWMQWMQRTPSATMKPTIATQSAQQTAVNSRHSHHLAAKQPDATPESATLSPAAPATPARTVSASTGSSTGIAPTATPTQFKEELESAMKLVDTGKPAEAVPLLNKILEKEPNNEMALVELAMIQLLDFKDPAASVPLLERALRVNPGNQVVMSEMLGAYEEMGQPDVGMGIVQQMYEDQPQNRELAFGIGKSFADMGDNAKALPYLADAAKDGKNVDAMEQYGRALSATGSPDEALDIYRGIVEKEEENQKSGAYANEPNQGKDKVALARMTVAHALMSQEGGDNREQIQEQVQEQMAAIEKIATTEEAKKELFEKFRRKNMQ